LGRIKPRGVRKMGEKKKALKTKVRHAFRPATWLTCEAPEGDFQSFHAKGGPKIRGRAWGLRPLGTLIWKTSTE